MPKCQGISLAQIAQWPNVVAASHQAAKGKHDRPAVQRFFANVEQSLQQVQQSILAGQLVCGQYRSFAIKDPKPRIIDAASFSDRVVHHALINCIGTRLENSWLDSSYACRKGYGSHKAINKAAGLAARYSVVIKLDIRAYFAHIQHAILIKLLHRQFKGTGLFALFSNILTSFNSHGIGLPIGALTSQYFANHYLDGYQRWLRNQKSVRAELRYMDDVLIFCDSLVAAKQLVAQSDQWLLNERQLILKLAIIQYSDIGVSFCGFHISSRGIKLGLRRKRSYNKKLKQLIKHCQVQTISPLQAQQQANTLAALCLPGEHKNWQRLQLINNEINQWQHEV